MSETQHFGPYKWTYKQKVACAELQKAQLRIETF